MVCFCLLSQLDMAGSPQKEKKKKKITCRLEPLDVPGGLQEVASQIQEDGEKGSDGNKDPGNDDSSDSNHSNDLEEHLRQMERR